MSRKLRDVAEIHYGKSPNEVIHEDGDIPIIGTGGIYGRANRALYSTPAVVVPRKGSLNNPQYVTVPFWPVDTTYAVLPKPNVDVRWLYYSLANFDLSKLNEATGVPSINRDWLYRVPLGNGDNTQQLRIAEILSTVDEAIEQTEALITKTQQIKAGLMLDLFTRGVWTQAEIDRGDHKNTPAASTAKAGQLRPTKEQAPHLYKQSPLGWVPNDWKTPTIDELLANTSCPMRSGPFGSALLKDELVENGIPFLGIDNIFCENFVFRFRRFVTRQKFLELNRYAVFPEDVVITIMGTVGRCCVIPAEIGEALSSKHLWSMTFDRSKVIPNLICWQLNYASWVKDWFARHSQGAVMEAIQSSTLRSLKLPTPSMPEQLQIESRFTAVSENLSKEKNKLDKLRLLKQGLMHDLLSGARSA